MAPISRPSSGGDWLLGPAACTRTRTAGWTGFSLPIVLEHTQGSQRQAAAILGIARQTLREKLRELGITIQRSVETGEADEG